MKSGKDSRSLPKRESFFVFRCLCQVKFGGTLTFCEAYSLIFNWPGSIFPVFAYSLLCKCCNFVSCFCYALKNQQGLSLLRMCRSDYLCFFKSLVFFFQNTVNPFGYRIVLRYRRQLGFHVNFSGELTVHGQYQLPSSPGISEFAEVYALPCAQVQAAVGYGYSNRITDD